MEKVKKLFLPKPITLSNGKQVQPTLNPLVYVGPILIFLIYYSMKITGFSFKILFARGEQFWIILNRMLPPNLGYFSNVITPLIATIMMSVVGTLIGVVFALPMAYASSSAMNQFKILRNITKAISSVLRTLPVLVLALIFRIIFGPGTFAGTAAITVFTFTIMTKMFYELIDTADLGPFEALLSSGATRVQAFWSAIMPQLWGQYFSLVFYNFEMNIRNAAILGYVGAGGIGIILNEKLAWRVYPDVGLILLVLMVTVLIIENISRTIRKRLL